MAFDNSGTKFLAENVEKFHSTDLNHAPLEGSTIFLYRSSMSHSPLDSSRLAELKDAFFSRTRRKTKKLRRSNLFSTELAMYGDDGPACGREYQRT